MAKITVFVIVPLVRPAELTVAPASEPTIVRSPDVPETRLQQEIDLREGFIRFDATDINRGARALVAAGLDEACARDLARASLRAVFGQAQFEAE